MFKSVGCEVAESNNTSGPLWSEGITGIKHPEPSTPRDYRCRAASAIFRRLIRSLILAFDVVPRQPHCSNVPGTGVASSRFRPSYRTKTHPSY